MAIIMTPLVVRVLFEWILGRIPLITKINH